MDLTIIIGNVEVSNCNLENEIYDKTPPREGTPPRREFQQIPPREVNLHT
jgi:hypothetical protein